MSLIRKLSPVCCLLFALLAGCAPTTPLVQKISDKQDTCLYSGLAGLVKKKSEEIKTLKGSAEVKTILKDGRIIAGRAAVLVKRPDRFRMEVSGPFNQAAFVIIFDGKELSLFSFKENRLYRDYPLPAEASRLPQYLLGLPASKSIEPEAASSGQFSDGCLLNSGDEQILTNQQGDIKKIIFSGAKVSMDSYKESGGVNFPFAISINDKETDIFIRYDSIELNQQISDDLFNPLFP